MSMEIARTPNPPTLSRGKHSLKLLLRLDKKTLMQPMVDMRHTSPFGTMRWPNSSKLAKAQEINPAPLEPRNRH